MAIPHQQAADNKILEIRSEYIEEEADEIVRMAEEAAESAGSSMLTRGYVLGAMFRYKNVAGRQPKK